MSNFWGMLKKGSLVNNWELQFHGVYITSLDPCNLGLAHCTHAYDLISEPPQPRYNAHHLLKFPPPYPPFGTCVTPHFHPFPHFNLIVTLFKPITMLWVWIWEIFHWILSYFVEYWIWRIFYWILWVHKTLLWVCIMLWSHVCLFVWHNLVLVLRGKYSTHGPFRILGKNSGERWSDSLMATTATTTSSILYWVIDGISTIFFTICSMMSYSLQGHNK